jgi:hypothetical protein
MLLLAERRVTTTASADAHNARNARELVAR